MALQDAAADREEVETERPRGALRLSPRPLTAADAAPLDGAARLFSRAQAITLSLLLLLVFACAAAAPNLALEAFSFGGVGLFVIVGLVRLGAAMTPLELRSPADLADEALPTYTLLLPLHGEAAVLPELIAAISEIDYPPEKLQALLLLEADDVETQSAAARRRLPSFCEVLIIPPGTPRTKPRACNLALARATGELIVVYDAEDRPDPLQLREAAARFAAGLDDLVCLQAPLRVEAARGFLARQFALEYAMQFEVRLPALARRGAAFPLGGTSNHFRTQALRQAHGWDAFNVTEDADLGFRLSASGWRSDMVTRPTFETAPDSLADWLPQRTRWLKGHLQTALVHSRGWASLWRLGPAMATTLGVEFACALVNGPFCAWLAADIVSALLAGRAPSLTPLLLFFAGWAANTACAVKGMERAGLTLRLIDLIAAPLYWPLQSLAMAHALWRLILEPSKWDKTPHAARAAPAAGRTGQAGLSPPYDPPQARPRPARAGGGAVA